MVKNIKLESLLPIQINESIQLAIELNPTYDPSKPHQIWLHDDKSYLALKSDDAKSIQLKNASTPINFSAPDYLSSGSRVKAFLDKVARSKDNIACVLGLDFQGLGEIYANAQYEVLDSFDTSNSKIVVAFPPSEKREERIMHAQELMAQKYARMADCSSSVHKTVGRKLKRV